MTARRTTQQDPRRVGGTYRSGYWGDAYTVLAVRFDGPWVESITVKLGDGRVVTHCTAWDARRDQIIAEPTEG